MAELFVMPTLGQSMEEGTIVQWFKREGDPVKAGERLLEVMSDKANFEVEAPVSGILRKILAGADETVPVTVGIAVIGSADEDISALVGGGQAVISAPTAAAPAPPQASQSPAPTAAAAEGKTAISPRARKLADERGVAYASLEGLGTGPGGRVLEADVLRFLDKADRPAPRMTPLAARIADDLGVKPGDLSLGLPGSRLTSADLRAMAPAVSSSAPAAGEPAIAEVIALRGLRKIIADNVTRSRQTAPHVTLTLEVDMSAAKEMHAQLAPEVLSGYQTKLTFTDILVKASARALIGHPLCNAAVIGDEVRCYSDKNIGVAVATENGLLVPVIRSADRKTLGEISLELKALADRCRTGKQNKDDLSAGTFTITNLGAFGIDVFDPIIVPPQTCILGVGRIADKVVVVNGAPAVRPMMNLCLSFDHRALDGVPAARFLQRLKALLEAPTLLFA